MQSRFFITKNKAGDGIDLIARFLRFNCRISTQFFDFVVQRRQDLKQIPHDAIVRNFEYGRVRVLVDRHNHFDLTTCPPNVGLLR